MVKQNTYRILIWVIVILVATNLSMALSFMWHKHNEKTEVTPEEAISTEMPAQQRARFFRDELNLDMDQLEKFREFNRDYNRIAMDITRELEYLRVNLIEELGKPEASKAALDSISTEIGLKHTELKQVTSDYYLKMRDVCSPEQQVRLNEIFMSVLKKNEDVKLPGENRGYGRNRRFGNNSN